MAAIATPTYRQLVDETYLGSIVSKLNRPPTCVIKRTSTLSITLNTPTVVTFQAEQTSDLDGMYDLAGAPTLLTVVTEGWYVLSAQSRWNTNTAATSQYMDILVNGTTNSASVASNCNFGTTAGSSVQVTSPPVLLSVGDVVRLLVETNVTFSLQTSRGGTWLSAAWRGYGV